MAKFLIKIDRKSIKRNLDAGATNLKVHTNTSTYVDINMRHERLDEKFKNVKLFKYTADGSGVLSGEYYIGGSENDVAKVIKYCKKYSSNSLVRVEYNYDAISLMSPIRSFSYKYKNTKVKCKKCKNTFSHEELQTDYDYYGDNSDYYAEDVCPICGEMECCEIEFEKLTDAQLAKLTDRNK